MALLERLRPRWRHPDPEVRLAAVREMGADDQDRLGALARDDPDSRVRRIAIRKLQDAELLERLTQSDADHALRELAAERAREVLVTIASSDGRPAECEAALARLTAERSLAAVASGAAHESVRHAALARVLGDPVLRDIVRNSADPALRRAALDRIRDEAALRSIAVSDCPSELAVHALKRIDDADTLRAIAENRAVSKGVRQRAQALLASRSGPRPIEFKEGRARQLALCTMVQALGAAPDVTRAAERAREALREWQDLTRDVQPREDVAERFMAACDAVLEDAARLARRRLDAERVRSTLEANLAAHTALCERVERLDGADALRHLEEGRAAWGRLSPLAGEESMDVSRRFTRGCEAAAARYEQWRTHDAHRARREALVEQAEALAAASPPPATGAWNAIERRWATLEPSPEPSNDIALLQRRFASAGEHLQRRRQDAEQRRSALQQENLTRLQTLCTRLQELATSEGPRSGTARRGLQAAETALGDLGPLPPSERRAAWTARLAEAREQLLRRVRREEETEEWRQWANVGVQEDIIRRVEAVLESNDLAEGTRQLSRFQEEWARVASATADRSQALWGRFRTARNELRRRCNAHLADNLEKKQALCDQVAQVGDATAWNETAELIRRLQGEWKQIGPVPARDAQALWRRFREPCDRFFARRREHFAVLDDERRESARQKTALCEQVAALAESTEWETAAAAIRQLQAEWKRTGPLPRPQAEALWQRFRTACDRFFDRRSRREEIARETALQKVHAICDELVSLAASLPSDAGPSGEDIGKRIDEAWNEWLRLDLATRTDASALNERLCAACEQIASVRPESLRGTRLDPGATRKRRAKLCDRLENLLGTITAAPRETTLQEKALALRERLATNTIFGADRDASRQQNVAREVERIATSWAHLGPPLDEESRALTERFERAWASLRAAAK